MRRYVLCDTWEHGDAVGMIEVTGETTKQKIKSIIKKTHTQAAECGEWDCVILEGLLPSDCTVIWFKEKMCLEW